MAYKLCKCKNLPFKTTREKLYLHSIEASHYPLISCKVCGILMEREDSKEHADSNCNPVVEGGFFLQAMQQIEAKRLAAIAASKNQKENIDAKQVNSPAKKQGNDSDADIREDEEDKAVSNVQNV